ncbi:MAG: isocitrate lyase/PEP mutase family protein [Armatimonadetes bacterium]|nr:isocitrate lyase/PEP mutase family protein [Armatimonadota bacterium]
MSQASELRKLLASGETLVMPDAYDPLSARIIEKLGFKAVQCSGFSMALAACCPSEAEFGFERNLSATEGIVGAVRIPVMADGEDGFGDASVIPETIRGYVRAGVAGVNIEDQVLGVPGPRRVIDREPAVEKLRAARKAAAAEGEPDLIINARTDALTVGDSPDAALREAAERANLYLEAGADLAFVIGVATLEQVRFLVREVDGPLSIAAGMPYNMGQMSIAQLRDCGVARVSLPSLAVFSAIGGMMRSLRYVRDIDGFHELVADGIISDMDQVAALLST